MFKCIQIMMAAFVFASLILFFFFHEVFLVYVKAIASAGPMGIVALLALFTLMPLIALSQKGNVKNESVAPSKYESTTSTISATSNTGGGAPGTADHFGFESDGASGDGGS